jgi:copper chaperone CopZ
MSDTVSSPALQTVVFAVEGMSCGNCVRHIGEALTKAFAGMPHQVDLEQHRLTVSLDPAKQSVAAIAAVMDEEGYPVTVV